MKKRPKLGACLTSLMVIVGALLCLRTPLLNEELFPSMYSLNMLLMDETIQNHFRKVKPIPKRLRLINDVPSDVLVDFRTLFAVFFGTFGRILCQN